MNACPIVLEAVVAFGRRGQILNTHVGVGALPRAMDRC